MGTSLVMGPSPIQCSGYKDGRPCPRKAWWLDADHRPTCGRHHGSKGVRDTRTAHWDCDRQAWMEWVPRDLPGLPHILHGLPHVLVKIEPNLEPR